MIEIKKEELLKNTIDYEDYSNNVCKLTVEELRKEKLLQCGGCCLTKEDKRQKCDGCNNKNHCKK